MGGSTVDLEGLQRVILVDCVLQSALGVCPSLWLIHKRTGFNAVKGMLGALCSEITGFLASSIAQRMQIEPRRRAWGGLTRASRAGGHRVGPFRAMGQNSSQQIIGCFAERMIDVFDVSICRILANASFVDDSQPRIDTRAVPREHLSSNGCRKDNVGDFANASEGRLMAFGFGCEAFARDYNKASSGREPCQG